MSAILLGILIGVVGGRPGRIAAGRTANTGPSFQRLTFRPGVVRHARFAPDGRTIIYSAVWEGDQPQLFTTRVESPESRPLGLGEADVLAVSTTGELAVRLRSSWPRFLTTGTLARMPVTGGGPRELLEGVTGADWDPTGASLAVARRVNGRSQLEFPIGKVLYESDRWIDRLRISPDGNAVAFDEANDVAIVNQAGEKKTLASGWSSRPRVAWSPNGEEVWFSVARAGQAGDLLHAVTRSGTLRLVGEPPGFALLDIASDGRLLMNRVNNRKGLVFRAGAQDPERDLSWLDWTHIADISDDASTLLITEGGSGGGPAQSVYIRGTDGSPAIRLGDGAAQALSRDKKTALAILQSTAQLMLLPTGAGESRALGDGSIAGRSAKWFPDGKRIMLVGQEKGRGPRTYVLAIQSGRPQAITPEGTTGILISPDGLELLASNEGGQFSLFSLQRSGATRQVAGLMPRDQPIQWSADGRSIYVRRADTGSPTVHVFRLDLVTGAATPWKDFVQDRSGEAAVLPIVLTPDAGAYAYTYGRYSSDLYLVAGLR